MNKSKKSTYDQNYYQKNKEKILAKAKQRNKSKTPTDSNVFSLFQTTPPAETRTTESLPKSEIALPRLEGLFLAGLILGMTYFLISESKQFYFEAEGNMAGAWLKALILEGCAIVFSLARARTRIGAIAYKLILILIYAYSMWVVSGTVLQKAFHDQNAFVTSQQTIHELETEISRLESIRDQNWKMDRITVGRKYDAMLLTLREKLEHYRQQMVEISDLKLVLNTLFSMVCFRLLVMISNFACLRLLKRQLGFAVKDL